MESISFDDIFSQIKNNFYLLGIPLGKRARLRYYVSVIIVCITIIQESLFFFSRFSRENFLELTQLAPCLSVGILSTIKVVLVNNKRSHILELLNSLKSLYHDATQNEKKNQILRKEMIFLKYLVKYFFLLNAILICVYNFSPFFIFAFHYFYKNEQVWRLPYAVVVPLGTETWYGWFYAYFHSTTSGYIVVLYFTTIDALYFILTTHTYCQFSLLSAEITQLTEDSHSLNGIIKKHQHILKLAKKLDEIFEGPNLFNILIGSLEICALGFNVVMGEWAQLPGVMLFLVSVLLQILMISVFGENLMQESMKIGDAAFLSSWYKMDQTSKKTILLLIIRSQRPCVMTAYNNYTVISYQSFTKIISTSWSYFTLLKTIYSSERF